jgi:transcriptional regulator with PAS, ATPase and Fis domain
VHVQDREAINRLRVCARILAKRLGRRKSDFNLPDAVKDYEAHFIQQALEEEEGSITRAATKLGITHQGLGYILDNRQFKFFSKRTSPRHRKRSIIKKPK